MKYLVVAGCSHVVGTGLDVVFGDKIFRKKRWSSILAKQLKVEEINLGKDGGSNWDIYFTLMTWIISNRSKASDAIFVVSWTSPDRNYLQTKSIIQQKNKIIIDDGKVDVIPRDVLEYGTESNEDMLNKYREALSNGEWLQDYKSYWASQIQKTSMIYMLGLEAFLIKNELLYFFFDADEKSWFNTNHRYNFVHQNYLLDDDYYQKNIHDKICPPKYKVDDGHIGPDGQEDWANFLYDELFKRKLITKNDFYWPGDLGNINGIGKANWIERNMPKDGLFQCWWTEDGNASLEKTDLSKRYEFMCKDGKRADGVSTGWFSNGNLKNKINWKNNKLHGEFIDFFDMDWDNGNDCVKEKSFYIDGKREGKFTSYYITGQKEIESEWKDGLIHGALKRWYRNGDLMYETEFVNGKGVDIDYYENQKMKSLTTYDNGMENGLSEEYYNNGKLKHKAIMKDNEPIGTNLTYYDNGQLAVEDPFATNPKSKKSYRHGQKKIYNREGELAATLMYAEYHLVDEKLNLPVLSKMKQELLKIIHEPRLLKIVDEFNNDT
tara:strand:- start:6494 stop:8140 length:1647 start_codon:yes stop_codon:yes gene_type:complete